MYVCVFRRECACVHVCKLAMKELDERVGSASCMRERERERERERVGRKVTIIYMFCGSVCNDGAE